MIVYALAYSAAVLLWALVLDEGRRSGLDEWRYCKGGGGLKDGTRH